MTSADAPTISVTIPIFNEQESIPHLIERLHSVLSSLQLTYEVVFVDDGSSDDSIHLLEKACVRDPRWKLISFSRNFGHQAAVSAGIEYCRGQAIAIMDADLQDPPELLGEMISKWKQGFQVVYAIRERRKENMLKRACYASFYRVIKALARIEIPLDAGDFCLMDRTVANVLRALPERIRFVRGLRSWVGFKQVGLPYSRDSRNHGESKYSWLGLFKLAFDGIFSFSVFPLKVASGIGVVLWLIAFVAMSFLCIWWICGWTLFGLQPRMVAGWTSLISTILFGTGLQILLLALIGEYLSRIYDEVKQREPWIVARAIGIEPEHGACRIGWHVK